MESGINRYVATVKRVPLWKSCCALAGAVYNAWTNWEVLLKSLFLAALMALVFNASPANAKPVAVKIQTNMGTIVVELYADKAPITVRNFLKYVDSGFYSGTIFHRVIEGFMIQGGGFTKDLTRKDTRAPIKLEPGISNSRGTLAMARTQDRNSATSQFFVNVVDNKRLDTYGGGYAVFGKVTKGMDVVDRIKAVPTTPRGGQANLPVKSVIIKRVERIRTKKSKRP
jgi:peptidyl-prolyl cis-trans isomerase A (cyclophilin A)